LQALFARELFAGAQQATVGERRFGLGNADGHSLIWAHCLHDNASFRTIRPSQSIVEAVTVFRENG
jgi:hypothetical protein